MSISPQMTPARRDIFFFCLGSVILFGFGGFDFLAGNADLADNADLVGNADLAGGADLIVC